MKSLYLTFDDGPSNKIMGFIEHLIVKHIPSYFFLVGKMILRHRDIAMLIAEYFPIGNHSFSHPHLKQMSDQEIVDEIQRTQDVIYNLKGHRPVKFRPPYGNYDDRVQKIVQQIGMEFILWDISFSPDDVVSTAQQIQQFIYSPKETAIALLHPAKLSISQFDRFLEMLSDYGVSLKDAMSF